MVEEIGGSVGFVEANAVQQRVRLLAGTRPMAWLIARVLHRLEFPVLRCSAGRHSVSSAPTGLPVVELATIGARSSQPRTLPIIGVPGADRPVLVASDYGQQHNPGWCYNLKANPQYSVAFRGQRYETEAYDADGEDRERLWGLDVSVYPPRKHDARRAGGRRIPVLVLQPAPKPTG
jgi:deazaflavin-dependent oxidoreductase (nitroreductase family)